MKLNFELVPNGTWYKNLRSVLSTKEWDIVRKDTYKKASDKCMICNKNVSILDAHETWEYDEENHIQKLIDVRAVCKDCHRTIHIGLAGVKGELEEALENYCKVNKCSYDICIDNYHLAFDEWKRRSNIDNWKLDISWLEQNGYNFGAKACSICYNRLDFEKIIGNGYYQCKKCGNQEDIICEVCNKKMVIRNGKNGLFLGCSNFPKCKNTRNI